MIFKRKYIDSLNDFKCLNDFLTIDQSPLLFRIIDTNIVLNFDCRVNRIPYKFKNGKKF